MKNRKSEKDKVKVKDKVKEKEKEKEKKEETSGDVLHTESTKVFRFFALVGSLLCAITIWLYVIDNDGVIKSRKFNDISVDIKGVEQLELDYNTTIVSGYGFEVDVEIEGLQTDLNLVSSKDIEVYIDVSRMSNIGSEQVPIQVVLPGGISLSSLSADYITVVINKVKSKQIPVTVEEPTAFSSGVTIERISTALSYITISGPEEELEKITEAYVAPEYGIVSAPLDIKSRFVLRNADGMNVAPISVTADAGVIDIFIDVNIQKDIPIKVDLISDYIDINDIKMTQSHSVVTVKGSYERVSALSEATLTVDDRAIDNGKIYAARVHLPDGVVAVDGTDFVDLSFEYTEMYKKTVLIDSSQIILIGLPDGYSAEIITEAVLLTFVSYEPNALKNFTADYFTATVDLTDTDLKHNTDIKAFVNAKVIYSGLGVYPEGYAIASLKIV